MGKKIYKKELIGELIWEFNRGGDIPDPDYPIMLAAR